MRVPAPRLRLLSLALATTVVLSSPHRASAVERATTELRNRFPEAALVPWSLAKASDGALWFATEGGLFRYDGARYVQVQRRVLPSAERIVSYGAGVAVTGHGRRIAWIEGDELGWLEPPGDAPLRTIATADENLWALAGESVMRFDGTWTTVQIPGTVGWLDSDAYGVLAVGPRRVWALRPSGPELLAEGFRSASRAARTERELYVQEWQNETWRVRDGKRSLAVSLAARNTGLAEHDGVMWAFTTDHVARLGPGSPVISEQPSGPPLFDREGSLWLATFAGPVALPAPDTVIYTTEDGLPTDSVIEARLVGDILWSNTWNGIARLDRSSRRFVTRDGPPPRIYTPACEDGDGRAWGITGGGWTEHFIVELTTDTRMAANGGYNCASAAGWAWLFQDDGLVAVRGHDMEHLPLTVGHPTALLGDRDRLWLGFADGRVCHARADPTASMSWDCEQPTRHHIMALWVDEEGYPWIGTRRGGVFRRLPEAWTSLSSSIPIPQVRAMTPSPRGGVWISGSGRALRVSSHGDGIEVHERLRPWHGVRPGTAGAVLDTPRGDLWVASSEGLVHVPVSVRDAAIEQARPAWVGRLRNTVRNPRVVADFSEPITLELSAHALRDPFGTQYRFRLGDEQLWSEPQAEPRLVLVGMAPGHYTMGLQARVPGGSWVSAPRDVMLEILPPWYATWWFRSALVFTALACVVVIHRARMTTALRLQAQRTKIAADLHDEVGSTLSAIRLTAIAAATRPLSIGTARPTFERIADTSAELGIRLRDIVWCLRPESCHLGALARFLESRARQLLPDAVLEIDARCSEWPSLSLPVLRSVQLIGLEALHNVAKHARATQVRLSLAPEGPRWRLEVEDNGHGRITSSDGLGLSSMQARAEAIGASFDLDAVPDRGTRIRLIFGVSDR